MLKIRLQRKGKKKQAFFRIVLQEHTEKLQGKYRELLGSYDPHAKKLEVDVERVQHWISNGAQVSPTLNNLMVNHKLWDREKMHSWTPKKKEQTAEAAASAPAEKKEAAPASKEGDEKPAEEPAQETASAPEEEKTEAPTEPEPAPAA